MKMLAKFIQQCLADQVAGTENLGESGVDRREHVVGFCRLATVDP